MGTELVYTAFERIVNLLRADARRVDAVGWLIPVQLEVLHYLDICNRYSNTPAAVADYFGLTKGTISQTLKVLEDRGYLTKTPDAKDRRVIHVTLSDAGRELVQRALPPESLKRGLGLLPESTLHKLGESLMEALVAMQRANQMRSFGVCRSCRHHILLDAEGMQARCALTGEGLTREDARAICREHESPTPSSAPSLD